MAEEELDRFDRRILTELQKDGRLTNLELAERICLSASPCLRRMRRLESEGYISGYHARLDLKKVGLGLMCFVTVKIEHHRQEDAEKFQVAVGRLSEVISCFITSGESDILLQIVVPDLDAYRRLMMTKLIKLPGVKDFRTSFVIDTVKNNMPLELDHLR